MPLRKGGIKPLETQQILPEWDGLPMPGCAQWIAMRRGQVQATERALYYKPGSAPALFFTVVCQPDGDFASRPPPDSADR